MFEMLGMLKQGGWPMIPLGLCSLIGLTIILERIVALRRRAVIDPEVEHLVEQYHDGISPDEAILRCKRAHGPFARIIEEIIRARKYDHVHVLETMHAVGRQQIGTLERGLTVLEIIAGISPLIGLLGTVLGMVTVFNAITLHGLGRPEILSDGISKALVTTVAGLCVAIPALAAHSWLSRRVDDLATEMQNRATGFIAKIHTRETY